jgi:hypothetical protein
MLGRANFKGLGKAAQAAACPSNATLRVCDLQGRAWPLGRSGTPFECAPALLPAARRL